MSIPLVTTNQTWKSFSKTLTFTGSAGAGAVGTVTVGTVSGGVIAIRAIIGRCTTSLVSAGGGSIELGTTHQATLIIGATTATNLTTSAELWQSATPTQGGILLNNQPELFAVDENVIITVGTGAVTAGVLEIDALWMPLTPGATIS